MNHAWQTRTSDEPATEYGSAAAGRKASRHQWAELCPDGRLVTSVEDYVRKCLVPGISLLVPFNRDKRMCCAVVTAGSPEKILAEFTESLRAGGATVTVIRGTAWVCFKLGCRYVHTCGFVPFLAYDGPERAAGATHALVLEHGGDVFATQTALSLVRGQAGGGTVTPDVFAPRGFCSAPAGVARAFTRRLPERFPDLQLVWDMVFLDGHDPCDQWWPLLDERFRCWSALGHAELDQDICGEFRPGGGPGPPALSNPLLLLPLAVIRERALPRLVAQKEGAIPCGDPFLVEKALAEIWTEEVERGVPRASFARAPLPRALSLEGRRQQLEQWAAGPWPYPDGERFEALARALADGDAADVEAGRATW